MLSQCLPRQGLKPNKQWAEETFGIELEDPLPPPDMGKQFPQGKAPAKGVMKALTLPISTRKKTKTEAVHAAIAAAILQKVPTLRRAQ